MEDFSEDQKAMAMSTTREKTTGHPKGSRRSSQGSKATNDEMLTEVKKEIDEVSVGEDDVGEITPKDEDLDLKRPRRFGR